MIRNLWHKLWRDPGGSIAIETVVLVPAAIFLMMAGSDIVRYAQSLDRMEHAVHQTGNLMTQQYILSAADIATFSAMAFELAEVGSVTNTAKVRISSIYRSSNGSPKRIWMKEVLSPGAVTSELSSCSSLWKEQGGGLSMPADFTMSAGQDLLLVEMCQPTGSAYFLNSAVSKINALSSPLYRSAIYMPRHGRMCDQFGASCS